MTRFRLYPDEGQEETLLVHCRHARYVWNLAAEQQSWWNPRRGPAPGYAEQNRQLTEARHVAFAVVPDPIPAPGTEEVVGVDRGVKVAAALSTGELLTCPGLRPGEAQRLRRLQRRLSRAQRGSNRRARLKAQIARVKAREADRRKYTANADINAARNIAAGRAVTARGGSPSGLPANREPQQHELLFV
ncbi:transposase [Parafrankia sp. EUN1f]|uniref:transposase n=1 Tax=Parafrankia sp. EUN1f TaxID=102897 RepID=UPI0001C45E0D|nr:transposase [Parafrankia sp. EUN1f]EFC83978.1 hypothetical protein FrEUN1fDRAFT_2934 [Parafrankia sp. EUN1f]